MNGRTHGHYNTTGGLIEDLECQCSVKQPGGRRLVWREVGGQEGRVLRKISGSDKDVDFRRAPEQEGAESASCCPG